MYDLSYDRACGTMYDLSYDRMYDRASEVVETIGRRRIDICCAQESRWKGC